MNCAVLVVGAGRGTRHGGEIPKQYQSIGGTPVFRRSLLTFLEHPQINTVIAVIAAEDAPLFAIASEELNVRTVFGGASRTASVHEGLKALGNEAPDIVLIHDAARPLVSPALISRLIDATTSVCGSAPGLAPADALKRLEGDEIAGDDVKRTGLVQVQTPQGFAFQPLFDAYENLGANAAFADDLAVARASGIECTIIAGEPDNFKITRPGDIERAERVLGANNSPVCITASGFDVHQIIPGDQMMLCGVPIKGDLALKGHSDADAALHALTDALLGTIGAGDIGDHFPPSDPQWKNVDSSVFLKKAKELLEERGGKIIHVDLTIICERPKIKPHREAMRARLGELLGLNLLRVSVKATTTEGLGFTGRGEGLAVMANATVQLPA